MAKLVTLEDLQLRCREAADMVNSQFVTDPELIRYINSSAQELYDILIMAYGEDYYVKPAPLEFAISGSEDDLPADFYKAVGVDAKIGGDYVTLKPFEFSERNRYSEPSSALLSNGSPIRYKLFGDKIMWSTGAHTGTTVRIWYIPAMTELTDPADTINGVNGWEEIIVVDTAIKMKAKQEDDVNLLMVRKQELLRRIEKAAQDRDAGMPHRITDVSRINNDLIDYDGY